MSESVQARAFACRTFNVQVSLRCETFLRSAISIDTELRHVSSMPTIYVSIPIKLAGAPLLSIFNLDHIHARCRKQDTTPRMQKALDVDTVFAVPDRRFQIRGFLSQTRKGELAEI